MTLEVKTHTALHVLKGAAQKVLGAKWTAGVYVKENRGRLTLQYNKKPTDDQMSKVEYEANQKIGENVAIEELEMSREKAEKRWGDAIYDVFPLPPQITTLKILHIPQWNVNTCKEAHTKTTGEIGAIKITKTRYRPSKCLLEISFTILP